MAYRPVSADDARAKVEVLGRLNNRGMFEGLPWAIDVLLESLLPEGEELPDEFRSWSYSREKAVAS